MTETFTPPRTYRIEHLRTIGQGQPTAFSSDDLVAETGYNHSFERRDAKHRSITLGQRVDVVKDAGAVETSDGAWVIASWEFCSHSISFRYPSRCAIALGCVFVPDAMHHRCRALRDALPSVI